MWLWLWLWLWLWWLLPSGASGIGCDRGVCSSCHHPCRSTVIVHCDWCLWHGVCVCACCTGGVTGTRSATLDITPSVPINLHRAGCGSATCVCCAVPAGVRGPTLPAHSTYPSWWGLPGDQVTRRPRPGPPAPTLNMGAPYPTHVDDGEWEREKLRTKLRLGEGRRWGPTPSGPSIASVGCGIGDVRRAGRGACGCSGGGGSDCGGDGRSSGGCGGACHGGGGGGGVGSLRGVPVVPLRRALRDDEGLMSEVDAFLVRNGIVG